MWHACYRLAEDHQAALRAQRDRLDRAEQVRRTRPVVWPNGLTALINRLSGQRVAVPQPTGAPVNVPLPATGSGAK